MNSRTTEIRRLHSRRPRRPLVKASVVALLGFMVAAWFVGDFSQSELLSGQRLANTQRFLGELRPWPIQQLPAGTPLVEQVKIGAIWFAEKWRSRGAEAIATTLAISIVAILLAGCWGGFLSLLSARNLSTAQPFLATGKRPVLALRMAWWLVSFVARTLLTLVRALPEYIWAFILLALFGPSVWPMILALALHNAGILGKLSAEVIENIDPRTPRALRSLGASRMGIIAAYIVPVLSPRFMLYFFYRWESCVRESTVLGMLGMASLGFWIVDARARNMYDDMMFFVICGAILVVLGDLVSALVRYRLRCA